MKILVALDGKEYSRKIIKDIARLAANTLANIVFTGIQQSSTKPSKSLFSVLVKYQQDLCSYFRPEELPYVVPESPELEKQGKGDWLASYQSVKNFSFRIRTGGIAKQIIAVAKEMECDLIILGCSGKFGCEWEGEMNVPLRIAEDAPCSVLIIKDSKACDQIVSFLDQSVVSQYALEMVNQFATLHQAGLKIVGIQDQKPAKRNEIENRMVELLRYYNDRKINTWVKLISSQDVKDFVFSVSQKAIVALWMGGKQSLIKKLFSHKMVDKLLETTKSSLLILR